MSIKVAFYAVPVVFISLVAVALFVAWWPALVAAGTSVATVIILVVIFAALALAVAIATGIFNLVVGAWFGVKRQAHELTLAEREQAHRQEIERQRVDIEHLNAYKITATQTTRESLIIPELGIIPAPLPYAPLPAPDNVPYHYAPSMSITVQRPAAAKEDRAAIAAAEQLALSVAMPDSVPLLATLEALRAAGKLNAANMDIFLGIDKTGQPLIVPTRDLILAAIVGGTGSGKSMFGRSLITQWVLWGEHGAPNMLVAIDHDRRELPLWKHAPNLYRFSDNPDETNRLIPHLYELMTQRAELPEAERYNLPWVIICVEEIIDVVDDLTDENKKLFDKLVRRCRDTNFRIFSMAQYWRVSDLGKAVQSQARSRFLGACDNQSGRDFGFTTDLIPSGIPGRFTYRLATGASGQLQAPIISPAEVESQVLRLTSPTIEAPRPGRPTLRIVRPEQDDQPGATSQETKEEAARRLWGEGYQSVRNLGAKLAELGYTGTSVQPVSELINRLKLTKDSPPAPIIIGE